MSMAVAPHRAETTFRIAIWTALYALPLLLAVSPHLDYDLGWHLRTGEWIATEGRVPTTDPFSRFGLETGKPWVAYSWLFAWTAYLFHQQLGYQGVILLRVLLLLAVLAAFHRLIGKRTREFAPAALLFGLVGVSLIPLASERPWLFTILASTLTLDLILDLREAKAGKGCWLLPLLFMLWANIHIQFVYGLLFLAAAAAAPLVDRLLGWHSAPACALGSREWWRVLGVTGACLLATLLTPYGIDLYHVVAEYATQPAALRHLAELKALEFRDPWDWCMVGLAGAAAFALGRRSARSCFDFLLLAGAAWFGFRMRRDLWVLVLASVAVLITAGPARCSVRQFLPSARQACMVGAALLCIVGLFWSFELTYLKIIATLEREYPVRATEHVRELLHRHACRGPLYNHLDWGGYLIWHLPELPVAFDGRSNLHGEERLERMVATWQGLSGWDCDPDLASAGVVIAQAQSGLASLLRWDRRFELVYEDRVALVFVAREYRVD
jgi:hypothetical protein